MPHETALAAGRFARANRVRADLALDHRECQREGVPLPTYEYACATCGRDLEVQQSMSEPSLTECPECGAPGLRKKFTNVGVVFKGSGFYRTDSRSTKSSAPSAPKKSESSTSSSEAAPAKKDSPAPKSTGGSSTST